MPKHVDRYDNLPKNHGKLSICSTNLNGHGVLVSMVGDSNGLRYLAKVLEYMADVTIAKQDMPDGARAHIPLHPGLQLIPHSCEVQICRAEAKGTGEMPDGF